MAAQLVGESDGLTFWLARPEDYEEVMQISEGIYYGNDYLPHRYRDWMVEPDRLVIIARKDGRLVALESGLVADGGQSVILQGLRVCPRERGCGLAGVIQRVADAYIKQIYPSVTIKRFTRSDNPGPNKLSKFTVLARRGQAESFNGFITALKSKLETLEKSDGHTTNNLVALKDGPQLRALLLDPDLSVNLPLPGGAIIQESQPLKPIKSNMEILERQNLTWLVHFSNDKPTFMSFYTPPYPVPFNGGALRLNIDMIGVDAYLARKALIGHLEQALSEIYGTIVVHVYMEQQIWENMKEFCEGDEGVKQCMDYWEQLFLEKEMATNSTQHQKDHESLNQNESILKGAHLI